MKTSIVQATIAAALALVACREKPVQLNKSAQATLGPDANGSSELLDSNKRATAVFDELQQLMKTLGVRSAEDGDVGLIESSMLEHQESGMTEVLKLLREHGVQLALPDQILHGVGVWSVSPNDFDRALEILEREGIRERYPQIQIARSRETNHQDINGQQDGNVQPAIRPESMSDGSDKPQPEAEGRSR